MNTFDFGNGPVAAHRHPNGGGWVADTATVANTAYVGPDCRVSDNAQVSDNAKVYGNAEVFVDTSRHNPSNPPFILTEAAYWRCPVHVLTGFTWLVAGITLGALLCVVW